MVPRAECLQHILTFDVSSMLSKVFFIFLSQKAENLKLYYEILSLLWKNTLFSSCPSFISPLLSGSSQRILESY